MPVALETSKRKFHQLLDNLTKPSTSSSSSTTTDGLSMLTQPAAKRARLDPRTRQHPRPTSTISLVSARDAGDTSFADPSAESQTAKQPYYVPWSHNLFLQRLKTFTDLTLWTSKPDAINEVAWAKRGWTCVGVNAVACTGGCEQRVVISLRPRRKDAAGQEIPDSEDYSVDIDDKLIDRYVDILETGHDEECLWRQAGCKDDIYRLPIARPSTWQSQLRERYQSFTSTRTPSLSATRTTHPLPLAEILHKLATPILAPEAEQTTPPSADSTSKAPDATALSFALLGWSCASEDPTYPVATCTTCFRRLGLWLYTSVTPSSDTAETETPPMELDLLTNHREYCPWINASSQSSPGSFQGLAAWEILVKLIRNDAASLSAGSTSIHGRVRAVSGEVPANHSVGGGAQEAEQREEDLDNGTAVIQEPLKAPKSQETVEKEDRARFSRIKELTRSMTFKSKNLKNRLGGKAGAAAGSSGVASNGQK